MFQAPQILHCQASLRGGSYMVSWLRSCKISFKNLKSMHVEMSWWILKPLRNWWQLFDVHCTTVFNNCCQEAATNRMIKILDRISSTNPCKVSNLSLTDTFINWFSLWQCLCSCLWTFIETWADNKRHP